MLAERLEKAWRARRGSTSVDPVMRFSHEGLVLGAGTLLAKSGGPGRDLSIDSSEPRLRALLAAAHGRRPTAGALAHLRKAAERWSEGQEALAAMHLALSKVERLEQPEADAHRLFLADRLLNAGFEANAIMNAVEAGGAAFERLQKYDPDQPRVPAGSGRASGQWTSGDDGSPTAEAEVNPNTITPAQTGGHPYRGDDACHRALVDCGVTAILAAEGDGSHANDDFYEEDLINCHEAERVCNYLGFVIEWVPLLDRGGVIFPHKGVVILEKGQEDLYIPPIARGRIPPFRRAL